MKRSLSYHFTLPMFMACMLAQSAFAQTSAPASPAMAVPSVSGKRIWDMSRITDREKTLMQLTDLIRFKGNWYCAFHEGEIHHNHPTGRGRIISSPDGEHWETVALLQWDGADVREPKLAITAEGNLMANTSIYFVSKQPRDKGAYYQLEQRGGGVPPDESEPNVERQSVTWLTTDGKNWGSAYACPSGINTWLWEVMWHNGMGYSLAYSGKDTKGTLYRTRDGRSWRPLKEAMFPDTGGTEAALNFAPDNTAYCLLRGGSEPVMIGIGKSPRYQQWEWKTVSVDWQGDGTLQPAKTAIRGALGGPKLVRLSDGRLLAAGRVLGPGREDGRIMLFWVDTEKAILTRFAEVDGTSYAGVVEHEGMLWVSCCNTDSSGIFLAKLKVPDPAIRSQGSASNK
jgi:hypothetical protein